MAARADNVSRVDHDGVTLVEGATSDVRFAFTERTGGVSEDAYSSLNLGSHVGDDPFAVQVVLFSYDFQHLGIVDSLVWRWSPGKWFVLGNQCGWRCFIVQTAFFKRPHDRLARVAFVVFFDFFFGQSIGSWYVGVESIGMRRV